MNNIFDNDDKNAHSQNYKNNTDKNKNDNNGAINEEIMTLITLTRLKTE